MTMPEQRTRAVARMRDLVQDLRQYLAGEGKSALVPRDVLRALVGGLRHYPTRTDLHRSAEAAPGVWGQPPPEKPETRPPAGE